MYHDLAMSTKAEVEEALARTDTSDLRTSFRRELSHSIPPPIFYRNYRPDPVFGVPLVEVETDDNKVPKVMRMCIEEVEKRGLNTIGIYSVRPIHDAGVLQLRRRFESEKVFSFSSTDNIHSVAALLELYLFDLPEPLFMLSLQDYRNYRQTRARFPENNFSLLRSKIRELRPIHRASLCALLRHLLRVSTHSDTNATTVEALAGYLRYVVLRGGAVLQDGVHIKGLVLEDLIQNSTTLFDERPSSPSPIPSSGVVEATSAAWWHSHVFSILFSIITFRCRYGLPHTITFSYGRSGDDYARAGHTPGKGHRDDGDVAE
ncbi:Rho GTPase activation protein [Lactarius hatsudake]|nr:Rho GTPase activation protein [Lactarius hatsudake]